MTQSDIPSTEERKALLEKHLKDSAVRPSDQFIATNAKPGGMSTGYVGKEKEGQKHLIKTALKKPVSKKQSNDQLDLASEYIFGKIYERVLYDRAPKIGLVTLGNELVQDPKTKTVRLENDSNQTQVALRSKFFDDFQTLSEYSGYRGTGNGELIENAPQLQELEGFEKVIAASIFCGEADYHASNIGVVQKDGKNIVVKIDHGRSGIFDHTNNFDVNKLISKTQKSFELFSYGKINLDPSKLNEAIKEMIKISDPEIENLVAKGTSELKKLGVNPTEIGLQDFVTGLKKQREAMQEFSSRLDIISKLDPKVPRWLEQIGAKDPVIWAIENDRKIGEATPGEYCRDNKIDMLAHIINEYKTNPELKERLEIEYDKFIGLKEQKSHTPALDKLLAEDPKTVARIIDKQTKRANGSQISVDALSQNCRLQTLDKMADLGNILYSRENNRNIKQYFYDGLNKFVNGVKNIFGKGVTDKKLADALKEMGELKKHEFAKTEQAKKEGVVKKSIGKFTEKLLKSGASAAAASIHRGEAT